jgi:hypothetical protein
MLKSKSNESTLHILSPHNDSFPQQQMPYNAKWIKEHELRIGKTVSPTPFFLHLLLFSNLVSVCRVKALTAVTM